MQAMIERSLGSTSLEKLGLRLEHVIGASLAVRTLVRTDEWHDERSNLIGCEDALERNGFVANSERWDDVQSVI